MTISQFQGRFSVDGLPYTSVSSIIKTDAKLVQGNRSRALNGNKKQKAKSQSATGRGIAVHNAARKFLRTGECDLDPEYYDYFGGIHDWLSRLDLDTYWAEGPMRDDLAHLQQGPSAAVWCSKYRYIGIPDWVGKIGGVPSIIEFKTSDTLYRSEYNHKQFKQYSEWVKHHQAGMQIAAYANCWEETVGEKIEAGIIICGTQKETQFFIIEGDVLKKKLSAFHKLCREYRKIHG